MWTRSARRAITPEVLCGGPIAGPSRIRPRIPALRSRSSRSFSALAARLPTACSPPQKLGRRFASTVPVVQDDYVTDIERGRALVLASAKKKVDDYRAALEETGEDLSVAEQKSRARTIKELAPLAEVWDRYTAVRTAIADIQKSDADPDPDVRELFQAEKETLIEELHTIILDTLPPLLLPPLNDSSQATMMTITAGIGGGESARFVEELSKMYTKHGDLQGWKVEILTAVEGAVAKGAGGNGFREMTIKFSLGEWAREDAECFGHLMWEKGTHRVQRVPSGASIDKMQSSTVNVNVSPIYEDKDEDPLLDPKDVKEDVMRASGPGGQHVNKTESAIRLTHIPTGITVSMQDSRSQGQNRVYAWDVLRSRLSERKRQKEQEERNNRRLTQINSSFRGDKVRTYNFPQDRITDHRIGWTTSGLDNVLSGPGFINVVEAMKLDLTARRLENLLQGDEDIVE